MISIIIAILLFSNLIAPCTVYGDQDTPSDITEVKDSYISIVDISKANYSYKEMQDDIKEMEEFYNDRITVKSIGKSVMDNDITLIILGNPNSENKVFIHGSIHGREYMTTLLLMKQIEYYLYSYERDTYNGLYIKDILEEVALYYVPMVNPDGVTLSQEDLDWIDDEALKKKLIQMNNGNINFDQWKSNIRGVDLNRNFDGNWKKVKGFSYPSWGFYKGTEVESEPESKAIANLTREMNFSKTISYHAKGSIIYWYYYQKGLNYRRDYEIAKELKEITGYKLVYPSVNPASAGGYKDWYISKYNKPAFTIEIGKADSKCPLDISEFPDIWNRNKYLTLYFANE